MKTRLLLFILSITLVLACQQQKKETEQSAYAEVDVEEAAPSNNALTQEEISAGWELLFDGVTSTGWRGYKKDSFPARWEIADGTIHCLGSSGEQKEQGLGGDIITEEKYGNFEFVLEWKIQEAGNSGIFYLGQEAENQKAIYESAPEMQVLDPGHGDWNQGTNGNRRAGSLYDMIPAEPQNVKPAGEWNSVKIVKDSSRVEHWQNGVKVLEYDLYGEQWSDLIANSKFIDFPYMAELAQEGHFGLQDHEDEVWYRNIKIRRL